MAILDAGLKKSWKASLQACRSEWIAFGVSAEGKSLAEKMNGMPGLIDWHLHGQVSALLTRSRVEQEEFGLIPGAHQQTSFLLYHHGANPDVKNFLQRVRKLQVKSICLAETTFPEDFLAKVKQTFTREGINCTKLEPENT